jgi:hypothetical protein
MGSNNEYEHKHFSDQLTIGAITAGMYHNGSTQTAEAEDILITGRPFTAENINKKFTE